MNITVLYNKPASRFEKNTAHVVAEEDTEESAHEVAAVLKTKGTEVTFFPITEHTIDTISTIHADLIFNLIEWTGIDTSYAMRAFDALDRKGILYTGATKENYHDTCDKIITKKRCRKYGLPTAQWIEFQTGDEPITIEFPVIVKVSNEHSSVGISKDSIAQNAADLARIVKHRIRVFHQVVFAETFLTGREFQVTMIDTNSGVIMLPPAEIVYTKNTPVPLLTYESRWNAEHADYNNSLVCLAERVPKNLALLCMQAFAQFGFQDYARFDIRCDTQGNPFFLELNSNPGLGDDPEYGMTISYKAVGMTFTDFVWEIVESAMRRIKE